MSWVGTALIRILDGTFVVGAAGSPVVLTLSGMDDGKTWFGGEEENHS